MSSVNFASGAAKIFAGLDRFRTLCHASDCPDPGDVAQADATGEPMSGKLTLDELRQAVAAGEIDTVVVAQVDM